MLINQKEVKRLALSLASKRAWKLTRVSKSFLETMDFALRGMIQRHVDGLPSVGKTIMALAMLLMVSGVAQAATASWYDSASVKKEGTCHSTTACYTASGKEIHGLERSGTLFAASNDFKLGTKLKVCGVTSGKCVEVTVLDRGGFKKYGRSIDLCKKAFGKIASLRQGLAQVTIRRIP